MKKDAVFAFLAILVVAGVSFGLAAVRPPFQPTPSKPFVFELGAAPQGTGRVVMRVNGEPVTETEFEAIFGRVKAKALPYGSEPYNHTDGQIYTRRGGRGFYFEDPNGHLLEVMTVRETGS